MSNKKDSISVELNKAVQEAEKHNSWFSKSNILNALSYWKNKLNKNVLYAWINKYNFINQNSKVAIIMAGNFPLAGFHDLISVIISGNNAIIKPSSDDKILIEFFVSYLHKEFTETNKFVKKVGKKTKICCTRKTIPNLRVIQKYAVKLGGGTNHRFNLSDEFLIKDNHLASSKKFEEIVKKAIKNKKKRKITVEVDTLKQFKKINGLNFNTVLFDNMSPKNVKVAIKYAKGKYETEASGGITLKNIKKIAATNVDRISIGELTHSIQALDLKLEI